MKKYLILFDTYACPPTLDKYKAFDEALAMCNTLEIAKKYCEKLAKDMFGEDIQKKFNWYKDEAYSYYETLDCDYFTIESMASYRIKQIEYIDQV